MIGNAIFEFEDLRKLSRLGERAHLATIIRWANKQGIKFRYDGHGGIWTTMKAMNAALGLPDEQEHDAANEPYKPEDVI